MGKKTIVITESDLISLIKKIINEDTEGCVNVSNRASEIQADITDKVLEKFKAGYIKQLSGEDKMGIKKEILKYVSNATDVNNKMRYYIGEAIKARVGAGRPVDFNAALYDVSYSVITHLLKTYDDSSVIKGILSWQIDQSNLEEKIKNLDNGFKGVIIGFYSNLSNTLGLGIYQELLNWQVQNYPQGTKICDSFPTTTNRPEVTDVVNNLGWVKGKISEILKHHA